ncbi:hypothetical protein MMC08_006432 [Hypocenomyce scalaris]|nr:hypothetical protein [Hypocenomyce scalaris]
MSHPPSNPDSLKDKAWYQPKLTSLDPEARRILEDGGIPPPEVLQHVQSVRDRAWLVFPYPCIGMFSFVDMLISKQPAYADILQRLLRKQETLLDLGCGLAQAIRTLVSAGVPSRRLYALDVVDGFIELGFDLFRDREALRTTFVVADLLEAVPAGLQDRINIIFAGSFFHLFDWDDQVVLSKRAVAMLKAEEGSLIFGFQVGRLIPGSAANPHVPKGRMYFHNPESFRRLWEVVGKETGTAWKVDVVAREEMEGLDDLRKDNPDFRFLSFTVERVPQAPNAGFVALEDANPSL